jgi:hypothetical protein
MQDKVQITFEKEEKVKLISSGPVASIRTQRKIEKLAYK